MESKRGQIKIQDVNLSGDHWSNTKFCSDPICVASGDHPTSRNHPAPRGKACAMGMRPGRRTLRASMCSTQIGVWLGYASFNSCIQFSVLPAQRPDWGAYPWHRLCREYGGFGLLRALARSFVLFRESKWGQIKIQEDPIFGARQCITKFCSDPFCVLVYIPFTPVAQ